MIAQAAPPIHTEWLTSRAQFMASADFKAIEVVDGAGRVHGMAGFDGWTPNSVVVTIALDNPAALRHLLHPVFYYGFYQCDRGVMLATVRGSNFRSQRLCAHVGFKEVYRVRDGVNVGEDLILYEMRREDCRWIEKRKVA